MATYAQIDNTGIVVNIITVSDETCPTEQAGIAFLEQLFGGAEWLFRWSHRNDGRQFLAGIGFRYDQDSDEFIPPTN